RADFQRFWKTFGGRIGEDTKAPEPPRGSTLDIRAVRIRPEIVLSIDPRDVNVVLERLALPAGERFDLIVATNVLVYYDLFEQSLALANVSAMLRPGGVLLSNNVLPEPPGVPMRSIGSSTSFYSDRPDDNDHVVWYQRQYSEKGVLFPVRIGRTSSTESQISREANVRQLVSAL